MRKFQVNIKDSDGEEQEYNFTAHSVWSVVNHIAFRMNTEGDFYGHKAAETMNITVKEMIADFNPVPFTFIEA